MTLGLPVASPPVSPAFSFALEPPRIMPTL
jgi:hypothetical protein